MLLLMALLSLKVVMYLFITSYFDFFLFKKQSLGLPKWPYFSFNGLSFESTYLHMLLSSHTVAIYVAYGILQFQGSRTFLWMWISLKMLFVRKNQSAYSSLLQITQMGGNSLCFFKCIWASLLILINETKAQSNEPFLSKKNIAFHLIDNCLVFGRLLFVLTL